MRNIIKSRNNFLVVIPAREGSKGIPGKNIKLLDGKPLIGYTIEAALDSKYLSKEVVICSTDSSEIASVAKTFGALVPFLRPAELGLDNSSTVSVIEDLVATLEEDNLKFKYIVLLQPTSPLRTAEHINRAIEFFLEKEADAVVSVAPVRESPYWMKTINDSGVLFNLLPEVQRYCQRQQLPLVYKPNGAIYIIKTGVFMEERSFYPSGCYGFVMDRKSSIDIDDEMDWLLAENIIRGSNE